MCVCVWMFLRCIVFTFKSKVDTNLLSYKGKPKNSRNIFVLFHEYFNISEDILTYPRMFLHDFQTAQRVVNISSLSTLVVNIRVVVHESDD